MSKPLFLGIDTSCYTTSMCVVDENNEVVFNAQKKLKVKKGKRGLRQSEAFFQHVNNMPMIYKKMSQTVDLKRIKCVAYSDRPRNLEKSYMPVFRSGEDLAKVIATSLDVSTDAFSHQEGHLMASIASSAFELKKSDTFLALHISGGTTELLKVTFREKRFFSEIIGGTLDITAGQVIDRVGVHLGLTFPAGKALEALAIEAKNFIKYPIAIKGTYCNLSGLEDYGYKKNDTLKPEENAKSLLRALVQSLIRITQNAVEETQINKILITGGVSANTYLRETFCDAFENAYFGEKRFSTDNSFGTAVLGKIRDINES